MRASRARAAGALAVAVALVLAVATPAQAHNYLVASTPEAGSTITEAPETFSVTTNETLLDLSGGGSGFAIEVTDAAGLYYGDGCVSIVDSTVLTGASLGDAGDYRMLWQLVSADGHTVSGEIGFTWAPSTDAEASAGSATPPNCGGEAAAAPESTTAPVARDDANLSDVLWIGGAIAAVLVAGLVTLFLATRRRKA
ncbi:MAG: copper resistance CopC family protein [Rhodoglobus sp.]